MEPFKRKIEDLLRLASNYLDYFMFRLKNSKLKPIPKEINSILIIDLKYIGDLIIDTPLIMALKQKYPKAKIDILVPESMKEVLSCNPNLNKILTKKEELNNYDLGVLLYPGNKEYSILLKKKAKFRIGIRKPGFSEPKGYYLHRKPKPKPLQHKIEDNLDILKTININIYDKKLEIYINKKSKKKISDFIKKNKIKKPIICINTVSNTHPTWLKERFAKLSDILIKEHKFSVIFLGSKKDVKFVNEIIALTKIKPISLAGKTSIQELFAIIKKSYLLISIDTGAIHIAAALNIPVIALFGAGDPNIWHPYCKNHIVIYKKDKCVSCMKHQCFRKGKRYIECMTSIKVEEVLNAIEKLLNSNRS